LLLQALAILSPPADQLVRCVEQERGACLVDRAIGTNGEEIERFFLVLRGRRISPFGVVELIFPQRRRFLLERPQIGAGVEALAEHSHLLECVPKERLELLPGELLDVEGVMIVGFVAVDCPIRRREYGDPVRLEEAFDLIEELPLILLAEMLDGLEAHDDIEEMRADERYLLRRTTKEIKVWPRVRRPCTVERVGVGIDSGHMRRAPRE
jgi:hypothetical protein